MGDRGLPALSRWLPPDAEGRAVVLALADAVEVVSPPELVDAMAVLAARATAAARPPTGQGRAGVGAGT